MKKTILGLMVVMSALSFSATMNGSVKEFDEDLFLNHQLNKYEDISRERAEVKEIDGFTINGSLKEYDEDRFLNEQIKNHIK